MYVPIFVEIWGGLSIFVITWPVITQMHAQKYIPKVSFLDSIKVRAYTSPMQVCILTKYPYRDGSTERSCSHISGVRCYHDSVGGGYSESTYCDGSVTSSSAQDGDIWWTTTRWSIADCVSSDLIITLSTTNAIPLDKDWTVVSGHSHNCLGYTTRNWKEIMTNNWKGIDDWYKNLLTINY